MRVMVLKRNARRQRCARPPRLPPRLPRAISRIFRDECAEEDQEEDGDGVGVSPLPELASSLEPRRVIHESAIRAMTRRSEALRALYRKFGTTEEEREAKVRGIPERGFTEDELCAFSRTLLGEISDKEMRYLRDQFLGWRD